MIGIRPDLPLIKLTQIKLFRLVFVLLFVVNISPQIHVKTKQDVENLIYTIRSQYLDMMDKHSDWLKRILEIVKLELTYRQVVWKCKNDTCLYLISLPQPLKRTKRAIKNSRHFTYIMKNESPSKIEFPAKDGFHTSHKFHVKTNLNKIDTPVTNEIRTEEVTNEIKTEEVTNEIKTEEVTNKNSKSNVTTTKSSEIHMFDCKGKYTHYCQNGAKCLVIELFPDPLCMCQKGFTGKRCVDFSLSDTVQSLRDFEKKGVNRSNLNKKEHEIIDSVVEATARFTVNANSKEPEAVRSILGLSY